MKNQPTSNEFVEQGTEEWHKQRLGIPTASHYADVLAEGRYGQEATTRRNYKAQLVVERFTGVPYERFAKTDDMEWGNIYEPVARLQYALITGNEVKEAEFKRHEILPTGSSADGEVDQDNWKNEGKGGIEIKSRNPAHHYEALMTRKVPAQYKPQIQGNLMNNPDRDWWDWISFEPNYPPNARMIVIRCYRDAPYIENLEAELAIFCDELDEMELNIKDFKLEEEK